MSIDEFMEAFSRSKLVHLHNIDLDAPGIEWSKCWNLLDVEEKTRASRLRSSCLQRRWVNARAGLRSILASHCECPPSSIEFTSGKFGKPALAGRLAKTGVTFNLSHSGNRAIVAVASDFEVGIDIEVKKPIADWPGVAQRFFSRNENAELAGIHRSHRIDAFYNCWTRKEALIKATGEGLSARLDEFDVSVRPDADIDLLADYSIEQKYAGWQLESVDLCKGFAGAMAIPAQMDPDIRDHGSWGYSNV